MNLFNRTRTANPRAHNRFAARISVPKGHKIAARWQPRIGAIVPNFCAPSTKGPVSFHSWAEGRWTVLFSHPCASTPVCTTELADLAERYVEFEERGVSLMGISQSTIEEESAWIEDVQSEFDVEIDFPMVADPAKTISRHFGIYEPSDTPGFAVRRSFLIDPALRLRIAQEYPVMIGRGTDEILRVIDAIQTSDEHGVAIPSDWQAGGTCLLLPTTTDKQANRMFRSGWARINKHLRVVEFAALQQRRRRNTEGDLVLSGEEEE